MILLIFFYIANHYLYTNFLFFLLLLLLPLTHLSTPLSFLSSLPPSPPFLQNTIGVCSLSSVAFPPQNLRTSNRFRSAITDVGLLCCTPHHSLLRMRERPPDSPLHRSQRHTALGTPHLPLKTALINP